MRVDDQDPTIPVIWTKHQDQIVAVTNTERRLQGWTETLSPGLGQTLAQLIGRPTVGSATVQTRTFTMRDVDLAFWDNATRKGSDGYCYGLVWGEDNKFLKNLQFKEITPGSHAGVGVGQAPPIDPAMIAMVAAMHQIQQTLDRIEDKVDRILVVVEWLEERRQSRQAAELLTAVATLKSVARRCFSTGVVEPEDLFRIGHLEQVIGTAHREICMELADLTKKFAYADTKGATEVLGISPGRIADLVALDVLALNGLVAWHQLTLLSKTRTGRLEVGEVDASREELRELLQTARDAVAGFTAVKTRMENRSIWAYMAKTGIPAGRAADRSLRNDANAVRKKAKKGVRLAAASLEGVSGSLDELDIVLPSGADPLELLAAAPSS